VVIAMMASGFYFYVFTIQYSRNGTDLSFYSTKGMIEAIGNEVTREKLFQKVQEMTRDEFRTIIGHEMPEQYAVIFLSIDPN
jgi:hypothetical protein